MLTIEPYFRVLPMFLIHQLLVLWHRCHFWC